MEVEEELKKVCEEIAKLPFVLNPSKEEKAREDNLWSKKRELLAKLNHYNVYQYA
jgi:GTPase SAR1 family protein